MTLTQRLHDRIWHEVSERLTSGGHRPEDAVPGAGAGNESVSGTMPWTAACGSFADGARGSAGFRRERSVREVVETLGPSDGRFHAARVLERAPELLRDERVRRVDGWGDPIRWPAWLLGTSESFSPTTLRYLSHALWLRETGRVRQGGWIVEIGVGFGGLAAMNAIVSGARTVLVDLPVVCEAARRALEEMGLGDHVAHEGMPAGESFAVVSNYAFTELGTGLQELYADRYIKGSAHGMIVSNAAVFSRGIGGRDDEELAALLRSSGVAAQIDRQSPILGPTDLRVGVVELRW